MLCRVGRHFPTLQNKLQPEAARCVLLWRCPRSQASGLSQIHSEVTDKGLSPTSISLAILGHPDSFTTEIPRLLRLSLPWLRAWENEVKPFRSRARTM